MKASEYYRQKTQSLGYTYVADSMDLASDSGVIGGSETYRLRRTTPQNGHITPLKVTQGHSSSHTLAPSCVAYMQIPLNESYKRTSYLAPFSIYRELLIKLARRTDGRTDGRADRRINLTMCKAACTTLGLYCQ